MVTHYQCLLYNLAGCIQPVQTVFLIHNVYWMKSCVFVGIVMQKQNALFQTPER